MTDRRFLLCVLLHAFTLQLWAQGLPFQQVSAEDGLSDNAVTCLFEDRDGLIWVGTEKGLNRYDGQRVEHIDGTDQHITAVDQDETGIIWFSTIGNGLGRMDPAGSLLRWYRHDPRGANSLPTDALNQVLVVDRHLLVISTRSEGAVWFDPDRGVIRSRGFRDPVIDAHGDTVRRENETWCHTALRVDERHIWLPFVHTADTYIVEARTGAPFKVIHKCLPPSKQILTNAAVVGGELIIGGWAPGLQRFALAGDGPAVCLPLEDEVTAIVPWEANTFLAGTKLHGILHLDLQGTVLQRLRHQRNNASSLTSDRVRCMMKDRAGNLWVGTAEGLSVHAPSVWRFEPVPLLPDTTTGGLVFHRLQQDRDGTIRVATSEGFFLVDPVALDVRRVALRSTEHPLEATGLFEAASGVHYLGTETGVYRYDPRTERLLDDPPDKLFARYYTDGMFQVRGVFLDTVNDVPRAVISALGFGSLLIDPFNSAATAGTPGYPSTGPGALLVRDQERDGHGDYWSATAYCLMRWRPGRTGQAATFTRWSSSPGAEHPLQGHDVTDVLIRSDTVWAGLRDGGLVRIVNERTETFQPPPHLPQGALGLTVDRDGRAWYTTTNGLVRCDPQNGQWLHVPVNDGRQFKRLSGCILALQDGRIGFCADNHLVLFDPRAFDGSPCILEPRLVDVSNSWGALALDADATLELDYSASAFDALITATRPVGPGRSLFLCRLEGIDVQPRITSAREPLRYVGVPPGSRRLLVRVRDEFGREGPERALLTITVVGPFWQRWWFFVLVLAAGALGMWAFSRLRHRQRMRLQHVRDRIARDLHDDIGSTLGSISFYSEALKRKLGDTDDAMARQVADRIGASSREMIDQMADIVWSVDPKNDAAGALGTRLQAFASDLLATRHIALHFTVDPVLNERKLSAEQRRNLFLICKEVLHNTVKYAEARSVTIALKASGRSLLLELSDDGVGFDPANTDSYNGNGLPNMRVRAAAIGAELILQSGRGRGTRVRIAVPPNAITPRSGD